MGNGQHANRHRIAQAAENRFATRRRRSLVGFVIVLGIGLALLPIVLGGNKAGHEIEHPLAVVILGGLLTSTVLNLFLMPALYLRFGKQK